MGAGRKTSTYNCDTTNGKIAPHFRNLPANLLRGVIFGATKETMNECLTSQLFGLPKRHISYVQHIVDGMPLFLFSYSDRKMYGIFEADGHGDECIDPKAWASGNQETYYPAQ
eukprot:jgi/Mesen1/6337/ME000328S05622